MICERRSRVEQDADVGTKMSGAEVRRHHEAQTEVGMKLGRRLCPRTVRRAQRNAPSGSEETCHFCSQIRMGLGGPAGARLAVTRTGMALTSLSWMHVLGAAPGATSQHQVLAKTHIPGPQMRNTWSEV